MILKSYDRVPSNVEAMSWTGTEEEFDTLLKWGARVYPTTYANVVDPALEHRGSISVWNDHFDHYVACRPVSWVVREDEDFFVVSPDYFTTHFTESVT